MNYELIYLLRKAYFEPQPQDLPLGLSPAMVKLETSTFPLG
jgi:hypothetical protein